jgi:hypothetical protein
MTVPLNYYWHRFNCLVRLASNINKDINFYFYSHFKYFFLQLLKSFDNMNMYFGDRVVLYVHFAGNLRWQWINNFRNIFSKPIKQIGFHIFLLTLLSSFWNRFATFFAALFTSYCKSTSRGPKAFFFFKSKFVICKIFLSKATLSMKTFLVMYIIYIFTTWCHSNSENVWRKQTLLQKKQYK